MNEKPIFSNETYDYLKEFTQIWLPAMGALYFGLSEIWNFPNGTEVVGSIAILTTFFGTLLRVSTTRYNNSEAKFDGAIEAATDETGAKTLTFDFNVDPLDLDQKREITLKINKQ